MLYLFSSTSRELYRRDILDGCCYPEGHVLRFRYSESFVPESIKQQPNRLIQEQGLLIFADSPTTQSTIEPSAPLVTVAGAQQPPEFRFYPIRELKIRDIHFAASLLFVDAELGRFVNYDVGPSHEQEWDKSIKALPNHPRPDPHSGTSFFIYWNDGIGIQYSTLEHRRHSAWRSVVERVNDSSLKDCITYQISGFYYVGTRWQRARSWFNDRLAAVARAIRSTSATRQWLADRITPSSLEVRRAIKAAYSVGNCIYPLKTGRSVVLKMLFYRKTETTYSNQVLQLSWDKQIFSSVSKDQFRIQSRYNQEDVLLRCNRLSDPALATLKFSQAENPNKNVWASEPSFLVEVKPPAGYVASVLVIFGFGLLCLNTSAADLKAYVGPYLPTLASHVSPVITFWIIRMIKPIGTLFWIGATWMFLRKFPLK
jgi:hypothetical protein